VKNAPERFPLVSACKVFTLENLLVKIKSLIELSNDSKQLLDWVQKREQVLKQFRQAADGAGLLENPYDQIEKIGKILNELTNSLVR